MAIRPLDRADLPAVAALMQERLPGRTADAGFLEATLLDHPWADSALPSLVAADDRGRIAGFIGAQPRRLRFGERELRGVVCSHLIVAADGRAGAAGALLLGRLMRGPQDVTWSDTATPDVARIWRAFGGSLDHIRACDWMLVLRPGRWVGRTLGALARRRGIDRGRVPVGTLPFHAAGRRLIARAHPPADPAVGVDPVDNAELAVLLPDLLADFDLHLAYDGGYLDHLFLQVDAIRGAVRRCVIRRGGAPIGWFAYCTEGPIARVLHFAARQLEVEPAFGAMVQSARAAGATVIAGRLEPHMQAPLRERIAAVGFARRPVIHAREPDIKAMLATDRTLLTQLDSEWYAI